MNSEPLHEYLKEYVEKRTEILKKLHSKIIEMIKELSSKLPESVNEINEFLKRIDGVEDVFNKDVEIINFILGVYRKYKLDPARGDLVREFLHKTADMYADVMIDLDELRERTLIKCR
jgi:hypothetical protein